MRSTDDDTGAYRLPTDLAPVLLGQRRMSGGGRTSRTLARAAARADRPKRARPKPTARGFAGGR